MGPGDEETLDDRDGNGQGAGVFQITEAWPQNANSGDNTEWFHTVQNTEELIWSGAGEGGVENLILNSNSLAKCGEVP